MILPQPKNAGMNTKLSIQWNTTELVEMAEKQFQTEIAEEAPQDARELIQDLMECGNPMDMFNTVSGAMDGDTTNGRDTLARKLLEVEPGTLFLILSRMTGHQKTAVKKIGLTHSAAHWRIKKALDKHPWLAEAVKIRYDKRANNRSAKK